MKRLLALSSLGWPVMAVAGTTSDALVEAARTAVQARLGADYADVSLQVTGRPADSLPSLDASTHLRVSPLAGRFPRERFTVDVAILRGDRILATGAVGFALSASREAWVYGHDAARGGTLSALDLHRSSVDVTHLHGDLVDGSDSLAGMRLKRSVRAGQPATRDDFERVPDVDFHQSVRLRATFGDIVVESAGQALASGRRGDTVTVQVDGATAPVKATVIDRGVAELVR